MSFLDLIGIMFILSLIASVTFAGDDPFIKGSLREKIKSSMNSFIKVNTVNSTYYTTMRFKADFYVLISKNSMKSL